MDENIPFQTINWIDIPREEFKGESGCAYWKTKQFDGLRIRLVEYSPGYIAEGMSYVVSDDLSSHNGI